MSGPADLTISTSDYYDIIYLLFFLKPPYQNLYELPMCHFKPPGLVWLMEVDVVPDGGGCVLGSVSQVKPARPQSPVMRSHCLQPLILLPSVLQPTLTLPDLALHHITQYNANNTSTLQYTLHPTSSPVNAMTNLRALVNIFISLLCFPH